MKKYERAIVAVAATLLTISPAPNKAHAQGAETEKCRAAPNVDDEQRAFNEKLADCKGVLKPPKIGDSEIREPAPDTGEIRIIRPQNHNPKNAEPNKETEHDGNRDQTQTFSFSEIVDSIGGSATTVEELRTISAAAVSVIDVSGMTVGANAAVIDSSIAEHRHDLTVLRGVVAATPALSEALAASGFSAESVIAARVSEEKHATLFVLKIFLSQIIVVSGVLCGFRAEAGQHSDLKPATIPMNCRPVFGSDDTPGSAILASSLPVTRRF